MYKNSQGYADPTAGAAMSNIMKEYRQNQRKEWRKLYEIRSRPKCYIVSPYAGDIDTHVDEAIRFSRYAVSQGYICIASHLMYPAILSDSDPEQRQLGLQFGIALMDICDEVWVLTDDPSDISSGMAGEIHEAKKAGKKIRYFKREVIA